MNLCNGLSQNNICNLWLDTLSCGAVAVTSLSLFSYITIGNIPVGPKSLYFGNLAYRWMVAERGHFIFLSESSGKRQSDGKKFL